MPHPSDKPRLGAPPRPGELTVEPERWPPAFEGLIALATATPFVAAMLAMFAAERRFDGSLWRWGLIGGAYAALVAGLLGAVWALSDAEPGSSSYVRARRAMLLNLAALVAGGALHALLVYVRGL